ncbi:MAG TPA: cysteine desulfurase family protein, partial [Polyangiaceae bacterium]|nr:cysteine desulfurase family protein [Polyangiaceae bacterium]
MTPPEPPPPDRSAPVYLDYNATTPPLPEAVEAMLPYLREHFGNASSSHPYGRRAREGLERARAEVAALLGASPGEIVFTSGGTEANNLAIRGAAEASEAAGGAGGARRRGIVTSVVEHPATAEPCRWLERRGYAVTRLGVDGAGRVRPGEAAAALAPDTLLVTLMHSNNETGALQPVAEIARAARALGALVHTDAAQSIGKVPVEVDALGVDLLSVAGHKLYAPKGVGALYVRRGTPLAPVLLGAGSPRPGTDNVPLAVALGVACEHARRDIDALGPRLAGLRERLWASLSARVSGLARHGDPAHCLPNTLSVRFPGVSGDALLAATPDVAASTGSACHSGAESASAVILAMGVAP